MTTDNPCFNLKCKSMCYPMSLERVLQCFDDIMIYMVHTVLSCSAEERTNVTRLRTSTYLVHYADVLQDSPAAFKNLAGLLLFLEHVLYQIVFQQRGRMMPLAVQSFTLKS
jgi:hypothetical protein